MAGLICLRVADGSLVADRQLMAAAGPASRQYGAPILYFSCAPGIRGFSRAFDYSAEMYVSACLKLYWASESAPMPPGRSNGFK